MTTPVKRRVFTEREDVLLLTQVSVEMPFLAHRGKIMDVWESVARNLATIGEFDRPNFDGKKAQARFLILLRDHRDSNNASQRASGAAEHVTEKTVLLDDLCNQVDEAKQEEHRRAANECEEAATVEENGATVRDEAMRSQGKRKAQEDDDESRGGGGGKMLKVLSLMNESNKCELDLRKLMFEKEMEERKLDQIKELEERAKDREAQLQLVQMQAQQVQMLQSTLTSLLSALVNKL
ncbi:hypothetical protein H310_04226 [Aphanomyces invadans]|uniref:Myb-like domain-containing protein n=1 Tax=Aphanomyces invadans TaxID=157072 RepID=A0A024UHB1_9STRA|nr:hypothetical protein H310_04226 [Aphanomyces invadans]ETW05262.1 hypothetical protein H310_04226 [Aphanomyces invadans]|eukprot:XP_008866700.1 hypothetical protein H310_04226 [Aphanomyces invadans]